MDANLEYLMKRNGPSKFKSEGEKRIAYFLEENSIKYKYEPGVLVTHPKDKPRIWYPDFYLPEFAAYIAITAKADTILSYHPETVFVNGYKAGADGSALDSGFSGGELSGKLGKGNGKSNRQ